MSDRYQEFAQMTAGGRLFEFAGSNPASSHDPLRTLGLLQSGQSVAVTDAKPANKPE